MQILNTATKQEIQVSDVIITQTGELFFCQDHTNEDFAYTFTVNQTKKDMVAFCTNSNNIGEDQNFTMEYRSPLYNKTCEIKMATLPQDPYTQLN